MTGRHCITLLAFLVGATTGTLSGQAKPKPAARTYQLRFVKLPELPQGAADSLLTVKAQANRVSVTIAIDNRCGFRPNGRYTLAADTVFVMIRYKAGAPESAICPGAPWLQAFAASTDTLQPGRYTIRVVIESGSRYVPTRVYRGELDI